MNDREAENDMEESKMHLFLSAISFVGLVALSNHLSHECSCLVLICQLSRLKQ